MQPDPLHGAADILKIRAWVDGASRRNPGPSGYGVYMRLQSGESVEVAGYVGRTTIEHTLPAGNKDADRLANFAVGRGEARWDTRRPADVGP